MPYSIWQFLKYDISASAFTLGVSDKRKRSFNTCLHLKETKAKIFTINFSDASEISEYIHSIKNLSF